MKKKLKVYRISVDGKAFGGIRGYSKETALKSAKRIYGKGTKIKIGKRV